MGDAEKLFENLGKLETPASTLGQNPTFYPKITKNLMLKKCEFCEKWDIENVNFVKNQTLKLWFLWKLIFRKCEFCE